VTEHPIEARLARLRGGQPPQGYTARMIAALASNPGCARRSILDAAGVDKRRLAAYTGYPVPFGRSPFDISRGNSFEAQVKAEGAAQLLTLLRDKLSLDISEAGYTNLDEVGGSDSFQLRHERTRQLLTAAPRQRGTMFDHPLLRFGVGGRYAYLEPDLVAFRHDDTFHVVEIKSFPVIDGQADPAKVSAAAIQSAVYVLALRDLLGQVAEVRHETILITPQNFSSRPLATSIDVRKQLGVLRRQLARLARVEDLAAALPQDLTFGLDLDDKGVPHRSPGDLIEALTTVDASYAPECLATCEMCFFCRDEADGATGALGKSVREDLGGIEYVGRALQLARGEVPVPAQLTEAAAILRRAAVLRGEILTAAV
jgi:hypothetical protein